MIHADATATYDPADDKLRLRLPTRLESEDYDRARSAGFRWAPKQELFFAVWNPQAAALLEQWCGEIGDEDTTLAERAEQRAERFDGYAEKREADGDREISEVNRLVNQTPTGQPVLVGHHSERKARRDAERADRSLERAVKLWETAEYWQRRAAGVVSAAAYRDRPEVRARRIKRLEAERKKRRAEFTPQGKNAEPFLSVPWRVKEGETSETKVPHVMTGQGRAQHPTRLDDLPGIERREAPWIAHLDLRIDYERAILKEQGADQLLEKPKRPKLPPILNYRDPSGSVVCRSKFYGDRDGTRTLPQVEMTKAEYAALGSEYRGCWTAEDGTHRVRIGMIPAPGKARWQAERSAVFLTDSKEHDRPTEDVA